MKKILSILMAIAMLFTFAAIPAMAEDVTVDFATDNIAYKKSTSFLLGTFYGGGDKTKSMVDGTLDDISGVWGAKGPFEVRIDLGAKYKLSEVALYLGANHAGRPFSLYASLEEERGDLIQSNITGAAATVNGKSVAISKLAIEKNVYAQYITIYYDYGSDWTCYEITAKGTEAPEGAELVNFTSPKNIAYNKTVTCLYGYHYSSSAPTADKKLTTDGDITTYSSALGKSSSSNGVITNLAYRIDLGSVYELDELVLYTTVERSVNVYVGALSVNKTANPYVLVDAYGSRVEPIASGTAVGVKNVNGLENTKYDTAQNDEISKVIFDLDGAKARYLTIEYPDYYSFGLREIYLTGTPYTETLDLSSNNLINNASISMSTGTSSTLARLKDTDLGSECTTTPSNKLTKVLIDLGDVYKITDLTLYEGSSARAFNIYVGTTKENVALVDTLNTAYMYDWTINNAQVKIADWNADVAIGRYIVLENSGQYSCYLRGMKIEGEKVTGITDAGKSYVYDATAGVTAKVDLFNGSSAATTAGAIYFAAYNADGELIGLSKAPIASFAVGVAATTNEVTFAVTEEPKYVKAFYWADGTFAPIILPIDLK